MRRSILSGRSLKGKLLLRKVESKDSNRGIEERKEDLMRLRKDREGREMKMMKTLMRRIVRTMERRKKLQKMKMREDHLKTSMTVTSLMIEK